MPMVLYFPLRPRYFDYAQAESSSDIVAGSIGARGRYPSALLTLSTVHATFGHTQEALQALNETFRMAQQAGDPACTAQALGVLCRLLESCAPGAPGLPSGALAGIRHGAHHHVQLRRLLER